MTVAGVADPGLRRCETVAQPCYHARVQREDCDLSAHPFGFGPASESHEITKEPGPIEESRRSSDSPTRDVHDSSAGVNASRALVKFRQAPRLFLGVGHYPTGDQNSGQVSRKIKKMLTPCARIR